MTIKGVGEKKGKLFAKLGIKSVSDLVLYYPRDYKDRTQITAVKDVKIGETYTLLCGVVGNVENIRVKSLIITKAKLADETGSIDAVWFNMPYIKSSLDTSKRYFFLGKIETRYKSTAIISPEFEEFKDDNSLSYNRIVPVYRLTKGLTQKAVRTAIYNALTDNYTVAELLPPWVLEEARLCGRQYAVTNIHFPETNEAFFEARKRLCFDEFFVMQVALYMFKKKRAAEAKGFVLDAANDYDIIVKSLPFDLTRAQKKTLDEIKSDMSSGLAMNRLIQGDVGSGKTAVALCASYFAIQNGYQAALMAPTEVLAAQHYETFTKILSPLEADTVLLNGSLSKKEKDAALSAISSGKAKMIIGTHAVIQKTVIFNNLGFVITDEQHRFGVKQRGALSDKGCLPHCLVMTATPIPRTLALILYGDLDISVIDELPPGRKEIGTWAVDGSYRKRLYAFIEKQVEAGRQAYIVCPAIESKEESGLDILYLQEYLSYLKSEIFKHNSVEGIHGRMTSNEKNQVMASFVRGEIDILVSTTIIEVGVNVPNATVMVIENAERFGLSQLHQLRGRVGRGAEKSHCILVSNTGSSIAKERIEAMKKTNDGFEISELDLRLRGAGDFFGTRQHGLPEMKIANLFKDVEILKTAEKIACKIIDADPLLKKDENRGLRREIDKMFTNVRFGVNL